jgi:hypothetical protein
MSTASKTYYVAGIMDGCVIATFALPSDTPQKYVDAIDKAGAEGFVVGDYVKGLNDFYKESANVRVPIIYAYQYVEDKLNGMSPKELADFEARLRKLASQAK